MNWSKVGGALAMVTVLWIAIGRAPTPEPGSPAEKSRPDSGVLPAAARPPRETRGSADAAHKRPLPVDAKGRIRSHPVLRKLNRRRPAALEADPQFQKLLEIDSARKMAFVSNQPEELERVRRQLQSHSPIPQGVLEAALLDPNTEVRMAALYEISLEMEDPPLDLLAPVLQSDPSAEVRLEALTIVADSDDDRADALIRGSLDDPDEAVRSEALDQVEARSDDS